MRTGYDSVAMSATEWRMLVPESPSYTGVIGSYANGRFANTAAAKQAFPKATHITYDVSGAVPEADILDVEPLDAVPADAPGWAKQHNLLHSPFSPLPHPCFYASASRVSAVVSAMLDAGFPRSSFLIQSAHYTGIRHVCGPDTCGFPQADGTQYSDHGLKGQNTDLNVFTDRFFHGPPAPDPDARYDLFDDRARSFIGGHTERAVVMEYDRWRRTQTLTKHPHRARLYILRVWLMTLALRLQSVMRHEKQQHANQAWRLRELKNRAAGKRLV